MSDSKLNLTLLTAIEFYYIGALLVIVCSVLMWKLTVFFGGTKVKVLADTKKNSSSTCWYIISFVLCL